ncbi:MAG: DUF881 domain-containing protein [Clostridia bacterium]|nr:DUF881 domain-containing protein [Clostridia bacterium]MDD4375459.1 DUF881 domain-containing protein [Clostridia bacterium]
MLNDKKIRKKIKEMTKDKKPIKLNKIEKKEKAKDFIQKNGILQYTLLGLAVFALVFVFVAQLNTVSNTKTIVQGKREAELIDDLTALKIEYEELKKENKKNLEIVEEYKTNASNNSSLINSMSEEINKMAALSGLKDIKGEGIVITLDDSDMAISEAISTESMLVHDTDLRAIVTELNSAGAEAISINGQRILSSTAIRCVGPVIQVNGVKVAAPFNIKAIGNAKYLESSLNIRGGIVDGFELYGVKINITREKSITVNKYDGKLGFSKAKIVEE